MASSDTKNACRTCLAVVEKNAFTFVDDESNYIKGVGRIRDVIMFCIPELDLYVSSEPVICNDCLRTVISLYNFKNKCLNVESQIKNFVKVNKIQENTLFNLYCIASDDDKVKSIINDIKGECTKIEDLKEEILSNIDNDDLGQTFEETMSDHEEINKINIMYEEDIKEEPIESDDNFKNICILKNETPEDNAEKKFSLVLKLDAKTSETEVSGNDSLPCVQMQDINSQFATTMMYQCEPCKFTTYEFAEAEEHASNHSNEGQSFNCTLCPFSTINSKLLNRHIARMHEVSERLQCDMCSYRTRSSESLQTHRATLHYYDKLNGMYKCPLCPYKCVTPYLVNKHIETKHIKKNEMVCGFCPYKTKDKSNFRKHVFTHGTKPLQCHLCQYQCISPYQMRRHIKKNHKGHDIENYKITTDTVSDMIKQLQQKES